MYTDPNPAGWQERQSARRIAADAAARAVSAAATYLVVDNQAMRGEYTDGDIPLRGCRRTLQVNSLRRGKSGSPPQPKATLHTDVTLRRWSCTTDANGKLAEIVVRVGVGHDGVAYDLLAPFSGMRQLMRPVRLLGDIQLVPRGSEASVYPLVDEESNDILLVSGRYTVNSNDGPLRLPKILLRIPHRKAAKITANGIPLSDTVAENGRWLRWARRGKAEYPMITATEEVAALEGVTDSDGSPTLYQASPYGMPDADLSLRYIQRAAGVSRNEFTRGYLVAGRLSDDPGELEPQITLTAPAECVAIQVEDWSDDERCGYIRIPVV